MVQRTAAVDRSAVRVTMQTHPSISFNRLMAETGVDLESTLVFRHKPLERDLDRAFDFILSERSDLFNCYKSTQNSRAESALCRAQYLASFVRFGPGRAVFAGLYTVNSSRDIGPQECLQRPAHQELIKLGLSAGWVQDGRTSIKEFELQLADWGSEWRGRLAIVWPGLERSWYRWADRNEFLVDSIAQSSVWTRAVPAWQELILGWAELQLLPSFWRQAISQWRGIYLITDKTDMKHYVGSAYGEGNILQRWLEYGRTGHGNNRLLRARSSENFSFCILQLTAPDTPAAEVIRLEQNWKTRLNSAAPFGLNLN